MSLTLTLLEIQKSHYNNVFYFNSEISLYSRIQGFVTFWFLILPPETNFDFRHGLEKPTWRLSIFCECVLVLAGRFCDK